MVVILGHQFEAINFAYGVTGFKGFSHFSWPVQLNLKPHTLLKFPKLADETFKTVACSLTHSNTHLFLHNIAKQTTSLSPPLSSKPPPEAAY